MNFSRSVGGSTVISFFKALCLWLCFILLKEGSRRENVRDEMEKAKSDRRVPERRQKLLINNTNTRRSTIKGWSVVNPTARAMVSRGTEGRQDD